jgi:hypothetical protein
MFDFMNSSYYESILYHLDYAREAEREAILREDIDNALLWSIMCDELMEELMYIDGECYE